MPRFTVECALLIDAADLHLAEQEAVHGLKMLCDVYPNIFINRAVRPWSKVAASTQAQTPAPTPAPTATRKSFHFPSTRKRDDLGGLIGSD